MKTLKFAGRNTQELLRDPLNLAFGLGFPLVLILSVAGIKLKNRSDRKIR